MKHKKKVHRNNPGVFCDVFGNSLRNQVLEFVLIRSRLDFAVSDILEEVDVSKPKAYEIIKELEKSKIIKKTRVVGGTQLYILDIENEKAKVLIDGLKHCQGLFVEQYSKKEVVKR